MTHTADHILRAAPAPASSPSPSTTPRTDAPRSATASRAETIVLVGAGKSGSKRLLKIFDLSAHTHCRCEPHEIDATPWRDVPRGRVLIDGHHDAVDFVSRWQDAVAWSRVRMSDRDRVTGMPKEHVPSWMRLTQMYRVFRHHRLRRALGAIVPSIRGSEWAWPPSFATATAPGAITGATVVLKIGPNPAWATWVAEHEPNARVVSLVRHPAAFLQAYIGRWFRHQDEEAVARDNRELLNAMVKTGHPLPISASEIASMTAIECELWGWRYVNEVLLHDAQNHANHLFVRDEDVVRDPLTTAHALYRLAGLPWTPRATSYLQRMSAHWQERTQPWPTMLDASQTELVARVLDGSPLAALWEPDEPVSRFDYVAYV